MPATDFFISYTQADRPWAEWIAWHLEQAGFSTVIQSWDFQPGGNWVARMHQETATAMRTIAVLSPAYLRSRFGQAEWQAAFIQDPTGEGSKLVPIRVEICEPEGLLAGISYIDLVGLNAVRAREALLLGVRKRKARPTE